MSMRGLHSVVFDAFLIVSKTCLESVRTYIEIFRVYVRSRSCLNMKARSKPSAQRNISPPIIDLTTLLEFLLDKSMICAELLA